MIKYRPHRGFLEFSMKETKEFNSAEEMFKYIVDESKVIYGVPAFDINDLELHELNMDDNRIGWKNIGYVCTKRYLNENFIDKYGTAQVIGHYGY